MTYFMQDNYKVYDSLPCSAAVFMINENLDLVYSNAVYNAMFDSQYIKINDADRKVLDEILATATTPKCLYFKSKDAHGKSISVRAFVVRISDDKAFALFIDESEHTETIKKLDKKVTRYAAAIRGTDETFYEYNKAEDLLTIFFSSPDGTIDIQEKYSFFGGVDENSFVYEEDKELIRELDDNVKVEKRFEIRLKIRDNTDYEWYSVIARPDEKRPGMFIGSARNIHEDKAEEEKLMEKALIDPLSKVFNRAAAIEKIEKLLDLRLEDCECALLVLDIDNFKHINDTFGHLYGDAVIAMAAGSIKNTLDEDDVIGRFGGDEFFVFIDNANKADLEQKLENIRTSILKMRLDQNDDKDISCSIGVALGNGSSKYEELFKQADSALYKAKKNGKNRFEYFDGTYAEEGTISYAGGKKDENESNEAHNMTAIVLEIASKSNTAENAVSNIMRHVGMALDLFNIQVLKYDTIEDKVYLEYQWWKELNGAYNVTITEKKMGYYDHNDLILFKNRFAKDKIFKYTLDFKEEFSQKYKDVLAKTEHYSSIYTSNNENENVFYCVMYQAADKDRVWTDDEFSDMSEVTKILSMYLKSSSIVSQREQMLIKRLDFDWTGLYSISTFYEEAGRVTRIARANGESIGLLHIDIAKLFYINTTHGRGVGDHIIDDIIDKLELIDKSKGIPGHINGTDYFLLIFRTSKDAEEIAAEVELAMTAICKKYKDYKDPEIIIKSAVCMFQPGEYIVNALDAAHQIKKGVIFDKCRCLIAPKLADQYKSKDEYIAPDRRLK